MPVLTSASASRLPGKRPNASHGRERQADARAPSTVAVSEIRSERAMISQVSGSPDSSSAERLAEGVARNRPFQRVGGDLRVGLAGVGHEERLAVLLDAERLDLACAAGETSQSAKALPPAALTRAPASGATSIT